MDFCFAECRVGKGSDRFIEGRMRDCPSSRSAFFEVGNSDSATTSSRRAHGRSDESENEIVAMEREKELEEGLIGLMYALGISKVRMMLSLALIRVYQLHEEMARWIASYHNSDRDMTAQDFMSKLNELTEEEDDPRCRK